MTNLVINVPGEYVSLGLVMQSALEQASKGKGRERHASEGEAYEDQIICEVARRVGLGYPLGQAVKKIYESQRLIPQLGVQELLGAMNYLAAAVIVMQERMEEEGRRFREGFSHAEGDRCQNGNDQPEELKFKRGDRVQYRDEIPSTSERIWVDAEYVRHLPDGRGHIVQNEKRGSILVGDKDIRPAPKADEEPGFKRGDKVQAFNGEEWVDCRYIRWKEPEGRHVVQYKGCMCAIDPENLRPVSRAEGCEALVEKDAPQTKGELMQRIVDCNPANYKPRNLWEGLTRLNIKPTFEPHKATSEDLAEMAEEEEKHG